MRALLHRKPGQKGTKQYGDRLVCVWYRYDAQRKKSFKTVELIIAERDWDPPAPRFAADALVGVRVSFAEVEMRERVKQAGGKWNRSRKVWERFITLWSAWSSQKRFLMRKTHQGGSRLELNSLPLARTRWESWESGLTPAFVTLVVEHIT
jgi:hypothetical protein